MGFPHHVSLSVSVVSLAVNCCSRKVGLGPQARGRLSSSLPARQRAKCSHRGVAGRAGGREGGSVFLSDPERQWSEHRAAP